MGTLEPNVSINPARFYVRPTLRNGHSSSQYRQPLQKLAILHFGREMVTPNRVPEHLLRPHTSDDTNSNPVPEAQPLADISAKTITARSEEE
jgi:hypothetical protein